MHPALNLPTAEIRFKDDLIWDRIRRKYLKDTPEEWVRQNFIAYLIDHLNYPEGLMASEFVVEYNDMHKRCDIVVMDQHSNARVIVECKAPKVPLTEDTFYQIARYNHVLNAPLLILTNGMEHFCALIKNGKLKYLEEIPDREKLEVLLSTTD